ncbi:hypothetical protein C0J52_08925 [Blattella germanica]|nr:hypothetical protein C0J52_08925 [Blattella germanica]
MHTPVGTMECSPQTPQDGDGSTALSTSRDDQDNFTNSWLRGGGEKTFARRVLVSLTWMGIACCRIFSFKSTRNRDRKIHVMIFRSILVKRKKTNTTKVCPPPPPDFANSILCIKEELGQLSLQSSHVTSPKEEPPPPEPNVADSHDNSSKQSPPSPGVSVDYQDPSAAQRAGWIDGLLGCLRPVWTIIGKAAANEIKGRQGNFQFLMGVCTQAPCYCIIMEYCPYGPLYNLLKDGEEVPPIRLVNWAKQIASGMHYLHNHKIIHRDLKSPNVLIGRGEIVKISDFGTSREWNEISTKMTFAGTVAWMAPEIIRNEPCSEKVDIWSYGVVLWELLTCETPYKDVDSSAIMFGVGNYSLHLPIPSTCPEGFRLLATWKQEIRLHMQQMQSNGTQLPKYEEDIIKKRNEELKHAQDIREHYERKLDRVNDMYMEMITRLLQVDQQKQELMVKLLQVEQREQLLRVKLRQVEKWEQALLKREKKVGIKHSLLKAQKQLSKRQSSSAHSTPTSPEQQTSPESPQNWAHGNPIMAALVLNSSSQPETLITSAGGAACEHHLKKRRCSRVHSSLSKSSPIHDKKTDAISKQQLVDGETQTEMMDISETDASPNPHFAARQFNVTVSQSGTVKEVAEHNVVDKSPGTESLNGNSLQCDDVELRLRPDPSDDSEPNCNLRLSIRESDDEHLETLGRKVSEILNGNRASAPPAVETTVNNGNPDDVISLLAGMSCSDEELARRIVAAGRGGQDLAAQYQGVIVSRDSVHPVSKLTLRQGDSSETLDSQDSSKDDMCEESWSEEEGEYPVETYMLHRGSFARRPVAPRCRSRRLKKSAAIKNDANGSEGNLSDEENTPDYSHPPSSQSSTLESNPDLPQMVQTMGSGKKRPHCDMKEKAGGTTSAESSDSESDDASNMTIATQLGKSPNKLETVV